MAESKTTLARGMFVREYVAKSGTSIYNVAINVADFCTFVKENYNKDTNGNLWVNLKVIPNSKTTENGLTHTAILDDYYTREDAETALNNVIDMIEKETPTKPVAKKRGRPAKAKAKADDLPF